MEPTTSPIIAPNMLEDFIFLYTIRDVTLQPESVLNDASRAAHGWCAALDVGIGASYQACL